jgi:uncharacterized repeat protein (TIGR01451 family)
MRLPIVNSFGFSVLAILLFSVIGGAPASADSVSLTPSGGRDTSDGVYNPANLALDDNVYESYDAERDQYDPEMFQEYTFTIPSFPPQSYLTDVVVDFIFMERRLGGAKLLIWDQDPGRWVEEPIEVTATDMQEIVLHKSIYSYITSTSDAQGIVIRFLAYRSVLGTVASVDWVRLTFTYGYDYEDPLVTLISPQSNSLYGGQVPVQADASDGGGSGIRSVVLEYADAGGVDWQPLAAFKAPPCATNWVPPAAGVYDVRATATDGAGNADTAVARNVTYNEPPRFENISPGPYVSAGSTTPTIEMDIRDTVDGVNRSSIRLSVNGVDVTVFATLAAITGGYHLAFTTSTPFLAGSEVAVRVEASDALGNGGVKEYAFYIHMKYFIGDLIVDMNHGDSAAQQIYDAYGLVTRLADAGIEVDWIIRHGKTYGAVDISVKTDDSPNPATTGPDGTVLKRSYASGPFIIRDPDPSTPDYNDAWPAIAVIQLQQGYNVNFDEVREDFTVNRNDIHFVRYMPVIAVADTIADNELTLAKIPFDLVTTPGTPSDPNSVAGGALFEEQVDPLCGRVRAYDLFIQGHYDWKNPDANKRAAINELDLFIKKAGMGLFECLSATIEGTAHWITWEWSGLYEGSTTSNYYSPDPTRLDHPFLQTMGDIPIEGGGFDIWDRDRNQFRPNLQNILVDTQTTDIGYIFGAVGSGKAYFMGGHERKVLADRRLVLDAVLYGAVFPKYSRSFEPRIFARGEATEVQVSVMAAGGSRSLDNQVTEVFDSYSELVPGSVEIYVPASSYEYDETDKILSFQMGAFNPYDYPGGVIATYRVLVNAPCAGFVKILDHTNTYTDEWGATYTFESSGCAGVEVVPPLKIEKRPSLEVVPKGKTTRVTLTLQVSNYSGEHTIEDIFTTDALPSGVTFVAGSIQTAKGTADWNVTVPNTLTWNIGTMLPGEKAFLTFQVDITPASAGTFLLNDGASVSGMTDDGRPLNDSSGNLTISVVDNLGIIDFSLTPIHVGSGQAVPFDFCATNIGAKATFRSPSNADILQIEIPERWGSPTDVQLPYTPTSAWAYSWSRQTRKLTFTYLGGDFAWNPNTAFCFQFTLVSPNAAEVDGFPACGTMVGGQLQYFEDLWVEVTRSAGVDIEAGDIRPASPCEVVYFPHQITNLGNSPDIFDVSGQGLLGWNVTFYRDVDGSGTFTPSDVLLQDTDGDGNAETAAVLPDHSVMILAAVTVPESGSANQSESITVTATSGSDPGVHDSNVDSVNVGPALAVAIAPDEPRICRGDCQQLSAGAGYASYLWNTQESTGSITVCPTSTTTYWVTVTDSFGCSAQDIDTVTVRQPPNVRILPDLPSVCSGDCVWLDAGPGYTAYLWSTGATTRTVTVCPTVTTTYTVTVTDSYGCRGGDADTVNVYAIVPVRILPENPTVCAGHCIELDAGAGYASYLWSTGAKTQKITVCPAATTGYTVTVEDTFGCEGQGSATVGVYQATPVTITPESPEICSGDCVQLDAGAGYASYLWSTGEGTPKITVCPGTTTTYTVDVTDSFGCQGSDSATVTVRVMTPPSILPDAPGICQGDCVELDAGAGYSSYLWSTGAATQKINVCPATTTAYSVTVTDATGCEAGDSDTVAVDETAPVKISPDAPAVCRGSCIELDAGSGYSSYSWNTGATTRKITVCPDNPTPYSVTATAPSGCVSHDTKTVDVYDTVPVAVSPPDPQVCIGHCLELDAGDGYATYLWSTGETTRRITICPDVPTDYAVQVTDVFGCTGETTVAVGVYEQTPVVISPADPRICIGECSTLDAGPGYASYLWSTGETTRTITVCPQTATRYAVTVSDPFGCSGQNFVDVDVLPWMDLGSPGNVLKVSKGPDGAMLDWSLAPAGDRFDVLLAGVKDFSDEHPLADVRDRKQYEHENTLGDGTAYFYRIHAFDCGGH